MLYHHIPVQSFAHSASQRRQIGTTLQSLDSSTENESTYLSFLWSFLKQIYPNDLQIVSEMRTLCRFTQFQIMNSMLLSSLAWVVRWQGDTGIYLAADLRWTFAIRNDIL